MSSQSSDRFHPRFEQLPQTLPVFPLSGVVLLPRARLPLNVFESRYLAMTEDALATGRLIGMVQPCDSMIRSFQSVGQAHVSPQPGQEPPQDLYRIGCAGRITAFSETSDGRLLVTLTGICRFQILEEVRTLRGYRRIKPDWAPYAADIEESTGRLEGFDRKRLIHLLKPYFAQCGLNADWEMIGQSDDEDLIDALAMICPFGANEKQALLEAQDYAARSKLLLTLIEMAGPEASGDARPRH